MKFKKKSHLTKSVKHLKYPTIPTNIFGCQKRNAVH